MNEEIISPKKAIVIGSSSGIGRALAKTLAEHHYEVGLCARRTSLLEELQAELSPSKSYIKHIDLAQPQDAIDRIKELISIMHGVDLIIINAGVGFDNPSLEWEKEKSIIDVNVMGFAAIANAAFRYFTSKGSGHIVGISSIAALRGGSRSPAYAASKAFVSNYLEGLRIKAFKQKSPITITDIKPGFVKTPLVKDYKIFWAASPEKAASQIMEAIFKKKKHAIITKRWRLLAFIMKILPENLYKRI